MRLLLAIGLAALLAVSTVAQSNEATSAPSSGSRPKVSRQAPKAKAAPEESLFARARRWANRAAIATGKNGKAYAEGLVRKMPKAFAGVKSEVQGLVKRAGKDGALKDLDEKRRYVAELWRLRASLDLMALLDARTLETITGVDAKTIESLTRNLASLAKTLGVTPTAPKR